MDKGYPRLRNKSTFSLYAISSENIIDAQELTTEFFNSK